MPRRFACADFETQLPRKILALGCHFDEQAATYDLRTGLPESAVESIAFRIGERSPRKTRKCTKRDRRWDEVTEEGPVSILLRFM